MKYQLSIIFLSLTQQLIQIGVVVFIVAGLIMFTYESTSFELEGFILVSLKLLSGQTLLVCYAIMSL